MKNTFGNMLVSLAALATLTVLPSCGNAASNNGADDKIGYAPEVNVVEVMTLKKTDFPKQLVANGKVSAAARRVMKFRVAGPVASVYVRNGSYVSAGDVLAVLDRPDLNLAVESARIALEKARIELFDVLAGLGYASGDTLSVPDNILSMAKIRSGYSNAVNALNRANYDLDGVSLKAPLAGRVADLNVDGCSSQGTADAFCTILDDSSLKVSFSVMESDYTFLETGLAVKVSPFADASKVYFGKITDINPAVDKNGQIAVCASIPRQKTLIDGMNVKVTVEKTVPGQLVVPRSAVVIRDNMDVLFTYEPDGKARWVYVNVLAANRESFVVTANESRGAELSEGDRVIISSNLNLADGSSVQLKE